MTANQNEDLWPSDLTASEIISPLTILARQGELLAEKTQSHVIGDIRPVESANKEIRSYGFILIAPGLEKYRFPLLKIDYPLTSIFPLTIQSRQIADETVGEDLPDGEKFYPYKEWRINSAEDLKGVIVEILSHPTTVNAVRALIGESKARGYDPFATEPPF